MVLQSAKCPFQQGLSSCVQAQQDHDDLEAQAPLLPAGDCAAADATADEDTDAKQPAGVVLLQLGKLATVDLPILLVAFVCGLAAAFGGALIPYLIGAAIDAVGPAGAADWRHFRRLVEWLLAAAAFTAVTASGRGSLFTLITVRVNTRLRESLFEHLLTQVCCRLFRRVHGRANMCCWFA